MENMDLIKRIYLHLWKQGKVAGVPNDLCAHGYACKYRVYEEDGTVLMCAAGCLISEEFYSPFLEGLDVTNRVVRNALVKSFGRELTSEELNIIRDSQKFHDQTMVYCRTMEDAKAVIVEYLHDWFGDKAHDVVSYIKKEAVSD